MTHVPTSTYCTLTGESCHWGCLVDCQRQLNKRQQYDGDPLWAIPKFSPAGMGQWFVEVYGQTFICEGVELKREEPHRINEFHHAGRWHGENNPQHRLILDLVEWHPPVPPPPPRRTWSGAMGLRRPRIGPPEEAITPFRKEHGL
jgi:hypothetical protein